MAHQIYAGHNHTVWCDGRVHVARGAWGYETQCYCFCLDEDFLSKGFDMKLVLKYALAEGHQDKHWPPAWVGW